MAITDTNIAIFLNRDDPFRRQKKWIKFDELDTYNLLDSLALFSFNLI